MRRATIVAAVICIGAWTAVSTVASQASTLASRLGELRAQAAVPAVAGALFSSGAITDVAVSGVRKEGDPAPATTDDLWHIGSITKSFTSLLVAKQVDRGAMAWSSTLAELFGAERAGAFGPVTLLQLLGHRAGLPANVGPGMMPKVAEGSPTVVLQRQRLVDASFAGTPAAAPGAAFVYSNLGYVIAGALLEARAGKPWEELVQTDVLAPLSLRSAGQGPPGEAGVLSQPRGHRRGANGVLIPVEPGVGADNPPYLGPAGRLHMTVSDLARWGQAHLKGERGVDGLVKADTFRRLHQAQGPDGYASGWVSQVTADRRVIWHNGSNTLWYAIVAFDPVADRGVALVSNGGIGAAKVIDAAAMAA
ncbi:MAG: beta-lactamase family protein, partial [Acidobacteria bacterium]|nr:beta-lactamase family protein [Acidobacteriota bacterium]